MMNNVERLYLPSCRIKYEFGVCVCVFSRYFGKSVLDIVSCQNRVDGRIMHIHPPVHFCAHILGGKGTCTRAA